MTLASTAGALVVFASLAAGAASPQDRPIGPPGMGQERKIVAQYDKDDNGRLDREERAAAREALRKERENNPRPRRGPGPRGNLPAGKPGPKVAPADVASHADAGLYDLKVLRTFFLTFENDDWEAELADFHNTDVEVPAVLTVDGREIPDVGVHFRGASSYMMVPAGSKRSLNVSLDFVRKDQRLYGQKTLNLLNANGDPSMMSSVLYSRLAAPHLPAPKANFAKVVINGESWGVYVSVQQFNKDFLQEHYGSDKGARWKVKGSPNGRSGLDDAGGDPAVYQQRYQMKSGGDKAWKDLMELCRTLSKTPIEDLESALKGRLNLEGAMWFLALDNLTANTDGYWIRASDFSLFQDEKGVFHVLPHDMNECFQMGGGGPGMGRRPPGGPGGPGGSGGGQGGPRLEPLVGMDDLAKPLRSRLLKVPSLRQAYLAHLRELAAELDWKKIGPVVAQCRRLLDAEVEADTRKLFTTDAFRAATSDEAGLKTGLRAFCDQRRAFLLEHPDLSREE